MDETLFPSDVAIVSVGEDVSPDEEEVVESESMRMDLGRFPDSIVGRTKEEEALPLFFVPLLSLPNLTVP
jgi:hypothetical protein